MNRAAPPAGAGARPREEAREPRPRSDGREGNGLLRASVVVVTKDRPQMLARLLESLTRQTRPPDEIVIVDNGSTADYTPAIEPFADRLPLRAVVEMTPGIPAARNRGMREAMHEIILFTDDDCEVEREWVENMMRPFYRNPYIGVVGGDILSGQHARTLIEQFCIAETLMRLERPHDGDDADAGVVDPRTSATSAGAGP